MLLHSIIKITVWFLEKIKDAEVLLVKNLLVRTQTD